MSDCLLAIGIGPVQTFIAAARKTRDLWAGSKILSDLAGAAAEHLRDNKWTLIFPPESALNSGPAVEHSNLPNVILATKKGAGVEDAKRNAGEARCKVQKKFRELAGNAYEDRRSVIVKDLWDEQLKEDLVEFYAAWVEWVDGTERGYATARRDVMRLLAARKATRDFPPAPQYPLVGPPPSPYDSYEKSSLDGARESVLKPGTKTDLRLLLAQGEKLDVVGLTKRFALGKRRYPSVTHLAVDPWMRGLNAATKGKACLDAITETCRKLPKELHIIDAAHSCTRQFPYDAQLLLIPRHKSIRKELDDDSGNAIEITNELTELRASLDSAQKSYGDPWPYLAILAADGDRMGEVLSKIQDPIKHGEFSKSVFDFAKQCKRIVDEEHGGALVYAGGDELLALLPVDKCLECAQALRSSFCETVTLPNGTTASPPTISIGIAIGHCLEDIEDLRAAALEALHVAKRGRPNNDLKQEEQRNALAVAFAPRGGATTIVRGQWSKEEGERDLAGRLQDWSALLLERGLPAKVAHDLWEMSHSYDNWPRRTKADAQRLNGAIQADARLLLKRKMGTEAKEAVTKVKNELDRVLDASSLRDLADELIVAHKISQAKRQANGWVAAPTESKQTSDADIEQETGQQS